ncbi:MAG: DUF5916 domain-containing protein [bacterium]
MRVPSSVRNRKWVTGRAVAIGLLLFASTASAHDDPNASVPTLRALKVDAPLTVDGVLDEPFWQKAEIATDFIAERTNEPAQEQTTVRAAYTKTHIYFAVECFDEKIDEIRATERREDRYYEGDDLVEIHLDPFHNHRSKYCFFSNPLGTRCDAKAGTSDGSFNTGWSADWDLAVQILEDRWVIEMRIPLAVMNYFRRDGQTWGLNISRVLCRTDTESFWSYNETDTYDPRHFGHLTGLDLAGTEFDRGWEIAPYVSSRFDFDGESDVTAETGTDISFRLSPSITTAWAINPDFGQIEADDDTIELRDTERFLPEKRPFFREGEELFEMRHDLYYSRRFTDIQTASKMNGKFGDHHFTLFNIQGDVTHDEIRKGNTTAFRSIQEIGEKSTLGYFASASELDDGHSRVLSTDGEVFLTDDYILRFQGSIADDLAEESLGVDSKDRTDYLGYTSLKYDKRPWDLSVGYKAITEGFNPILGYIPRQDVFGPSARAEYYRQEDNTWYKTLYAEIDTEINENEENKTVLRDYDIESEIVFANDLGIALERESNFHAPYNNERTEASFILNSSDFWRSTDFGAAHGEFEEVKYDEFSFEKRKDLFGRLPLRYELTVRFEEETVDGHTDENTVWLNRIVFDYFFTDKMWIKTAIQNRNGGIHNISMIYGWEFRRNCHWYLVFNSVKDEDDNEGLRSVFTKIVYTF